MSTKNKGVKVPEAIQQLVKTLFKIFDFVFFGTTSRLQKYIYKCKKKKSPSGIHFMGKFIQLTYRLPPIRDVKEMDNCLRSQIKR